MSRLIRTTRLILLILLSIKLSTACAFCYMSADLADKIKTLKWVAYSPTNFDPNSGSYPTKDTIKNDLAILYEYGFRGIVTYSSYGILADIPRIAAETGFRGVIMGIWDINSQEELSNALASKEHVDGYCAGNEGLNIRYDLESLKNFINELKRCTSKPVTTTEEINDYYNNTLDLISVGDWVFPNTHPFLSNVTRPDQAVAWVRKHYQLLNKHALGKTIFLKETGFPTRGAAGATESNQTDFFLNMENSGIPFVYFEAFDQAWKTDSAVEPHWGLFDNRRRPKGFASSQKNS